MYRPSNVPTDPKELPGFLTQEFLNLQKAWAEPADLLILDVLHAPPAKTLPGMIVIADGTDWNPGAGQGVYWYNGTLWKLLG